MARNKLRMQTLFTGMAVYGVISTLDDRVYRSNGTLEAYSAGSLSFYAVAAGVEEGASRAYPLTIPANLPAGVYKVDAFKRVGANPAEGDPLVYQTSVPFSWDGTNILALNDIITDTGTGARSITVTVNDGTNPLQGAQVRFTMNAETHTRATDVNGQVAFSLDDGTWTVTITLPGYSFTPTTLVVDGNKTPTYSMTVRVPTASTPGQTTGYTHVYGLNGLPLVGATVTITVAETSEDIRGAVYSGAARSAVSDSTGYVEWTNLFKGVTYTLKQGTGRNYVDTIPPTAGDTFQLISVIGE